MSVQGKTITMLSMLQNYHSLFKQQKLDKILDYLSNHKKCSKPQLKSFQLIKKHLLQLFKLVNL